MSTIIVKVNNQVKTVAEHTVVTKDGQPTVIKAINKVNYELFDESIGRAPTHIITKRIANDLHISFEDEGEASDLIIEGFYGDTESALIGIAEDGSYYYYIPDTGEVADYVTELVAGDIEGQALGGNSQALPWWVGASQESGFNALPWLAGLAGVGLIGAALGGSSSKDNNDSPQAPDNTAPQAPVFEVTNNGTQIIGTAKPGSTVNIDVNGDGKPDYTVKADDNGKFVVDISDKPLKNGETVTGTVTDAQGNTSKPTEVVAKDTTAPKEPTIEVSNDGTVNVTPADDDTSNLTVDFTDKNGNAQKIETTKNPETGKWSPVGELPTGVTVNPDTGAVTIPAGQVDGSKDITATAKDPAGNGSNVVEGGDKTDPKNPTIDVNNDGSISITPADDDTSDLSVDYTDNNGKAQKVEVTKDPVTGEWSPVGELPAGVTVNPETGAVTIPAGQVDGSKDITATAKDPAGNSSKVTENGDNTDPEAPAIEVGKDGSVSVTPADDKDTTDLTVDYTDKDGKAQKVEITKDPVTNEWSPVGELPAGVTVDPNTGKVTIPAENVDIREDVTATAKDAAGNDASANQNGDKTDPKTPTIDKGDDGSVVVTPADDKTSDLTVDYTDKDGKEQKVEVTKDPETGKWEVVGELPPGVKVDANTGAVTIPGNQIDNREDVTATVTTPAGNAATATEGGDKTDPQKPTITTGDDGTVSVMPADDNDTSDLTVEYTDKDGNKQKVETTKDAETGKWIAVGELPAGVTVDSATGKVTIPTGQVNGREDIKATAKDPAGNTAKVTENGDKTDPANPTITAGDDGSVTVKPAADDTSDLTVDYTDAQGKPQQVEATKDPVTGKWSPVGKLPAGVSVNEDTGEVVIAAGQVDRTKDLTATAKDPAGNDATANLEATIDNTDPENQLLI